MPSYVILLFVVLAVLPGNEGRSGPLPGGKKGGGSSSASSFTGSPKGFDGMMPCNKTNANSSQCQCMGVMRPPIGKNSTAFNQSKFIFDGCINSLGLNATLTAFLQTLPNNGRPSGPPPPGPPPGGKPGGKPAGPPPGGKPGGPPSGGPPPQKPGHFGKFMEINRQFLAYLQSSNATAYQLLTCCILPAIQQDILNNVKANAPSAISSNAAASLAYNTSVDACAIPTPVTSTTDCSFSMLMNCTMQACVTNLPA